MSSQQSKKQRSTESLCVLDCIVIRDMNNQSIAYNTCSLEDDSLVHHAHLKKADRADPSL